MKGRKPKPVEQRIREGNPGHRPLPEPVLVSGRPDRGELAEPPAHLPDEAKEFWREHVSRLVEVGMVDRVDVPALEMMATQYALSRQAQRAIEEHGFFAEGSRGQMREHPAVRSQRDASTLFLRFAEQFGLTPSARARLGLAELHRRSLQAEMTDGLGAPKLRPAGPRPQVHLHV
jgi:P27 family predicted phage terminase small subunit